ncbi:MAG: DEAD/DEAH box helicase [Bacteroides sp.]|nr:DEAD/DEAH box helicase [Bacteroides sp.]
MENNSFSKTTVRDVPQFPYPSGARNYQTEAYTNWIKNNYQGIFAMATGTGKTITSLNCILEEYRHNGFYRVLILVPTRALVHQWTEEARKFNYRNIYSTQDKNWMSILGRHFLNEQLGIPNNLIFISTYRSFSGEKFQKLLHKKGWDKFTLIADEVHNMGSSSLQNKMPVQITKRIGLSATPERIYDESGSETIYTYFNASPPQYTYCYSMYRAIHSEPSSLVPYYYYPYFSHLDEEELKEYRKITEKLIVHYNSRTKEFNEQGKKLLIKRKALINKAGNKLNTLEKILEDVAKKEKSLNYTFVYLPEGKELDFLKSDAPAYDDEEKKIIRKYGEKIRSYGYSTHEFLCNTPHKEKIVEQFSQGKINILLAMKILDEGVDIPVTRNAIFCASTGNPRQYIQRRGRVLRKSPGKTHANIYDIIIAPQKNFMDYLPVEIKEMEIKIFQNELKRVANFLYAAENRHQVLNGELGKLADLYRIDFVEMIKENLTIDKNQINS